MWHGFTYVDGTHDAIVIESQSDFLIDLLNGGPGIVRALGWSENSWDSEPDFNLEVRPGNLKVIHARFLRLRLLSEGLSGSGAAVGWRIRGADSDT